MMVEEKKQFYCILRKIWVKATPEENVRQLILLHLIVDLKFPKEAFVVEKELKQLPHLCNTNLSALPQRRADILCYSKKNEEMCPLLLIECKAVLINEKELLQTIGYNHYVKARFITLVNAKEKKFGWYDVKLKEHQFIDFIPSYEQLTV